jgi:murein DD-endopeptidase MepM/ murein hydrolase activator NlpD
MARRMLRLRLLILVAAIPLALWLFVPVLSDGAPRNLTGKIEAKQRQIDAKKGHERVLTTTITRYSKQINVLQGDITQLQTRQVRLEADLANKRAELARIQERLRQERIRLARLRARLAEARTALSGRLVEIYKADKPDIVTVILDANGFADLLERTEFMQRVSDQDTRIINRVRDAKADATRTAHRLDGLEARQAKVTAIVAQRRDQVAAVKGRLVDRRDAFQSVRVQKTRALLSTRSDRHALEDDVAALQRQQARITAALQRASSSSSSLPAGPIRTGSGGLIWPVNGPITSPFCESRAWERCHPGIDIGVPAGTPIRAAAAGTVVLMQSEAASGGYGNFTCVQHTATMSTCYAHQSRFATSSGAHVSQGQVIGYVGCTGRCFGDHLHFEVRINGSVVNPMNYL